MAGDDCICLLRCGCYHRPVFAPERASYPTVMLPIEAVLDPLTITHAESRIDEYERAMRRGDAFPPVSVIRIFGRHIVADGHKRLAAVRRIGPAQICVEVWTYRRWLRDQWRQATANARKNARIARLAFSDPGGAARLLGTTLGHWRRVARSLLRLSSRGA